MLNNPQIPFQSEPFPPRTLSSNQPLITHTDHAVADGPTLPPLRRHPWLALLCFLYAGNHLLSFQTRSAIKEICDWVVKVVETFSICKLMISVSSSKRRVDLLMHGSASGVYICVFGGFLTLGPTVVSWYTDRNPFALVQMIDDIAGIMVVNQEQECWCLCLGQIEMLRKASSMRAIFLGFRADSFLPQVNKSGLHLPDKRCLSKYQCSKEIPFIRQFSISSDPLLCWDKNRTLTPADPPLQCHQKENKMNNSVKLVQRLTSVIPKCCITYVCWPVFTSPWHQSKGTSVHMLMNQKSLTEKRHRPICDSFFGHFCTL